MHIASLLLGFMSSVTGSTWAGAFSARHWPTAHFGPGSAYCPVPPFTGLRHSCAPWPCDLCAMPACLGHWHLCPGTTVPPLFLGIRVGEAQHPGPLPSAAAPVLRLGACNPTGLNLMGNMAWLLSFLLMCMLSPSLISPVGAWACSGLVCG